MLTPESLKSRTTIFAGKADHNILEKCDTQSQTRHL